MSRETKIPPKNEFSGGFLRWFSKCIDEHYRAKRITEERKSEIRNFVDILREQLRAELELGELDIVVFGSVISGFGTNECDLDLCLTNTGIPSPNVVSLLVKQMKIEIVQ